MSSTHQFRVCHLTSVHPPFDTRIFHKECRSLVEAGYEVILIAPYSHNEIVQGVQIEAVPRSKRRLNRMTVTAQQVYQRALQLNAELYHFHDPELLLVGLLLQKSGRKVIYDIHEDAPQTLLSQGRAYLPRFSRRLIKWFLEKVENFAASHFSACVAATPTIEERFRNIQPNTWTVNNFPLLHEQVGTEYVPLGQRPFIIAYVGVIGLERGLRQMVEAMEYLPEDMGARLELAGSFSPHHCRSMVVNMSGWRFVEELGFLGRQDVAQLLSRARVGLVVLHPEPRYQVAQPVKLYEYMQAGIPVIASDFPLWRELIEREGCGLVVDPLNPQAIAAAIEYILTHPAEAEAMGQRGKQAVEQRYNWSVETKQLLTIYRTVLNQSHLSDGGTTSRLKL